MSKKPPAINLKESLGVGATPAVAVPLPDTESFLSGSKATSLPLKWIVRDEAAQPRLQLNRDTIDAYREAMREHEGGPSWGSFPPVVVFGKGEEFFLADGFHRVEAALGLGLAHARADVRPGGLRDAILFSVGANAAHGLRRTNEDKRRAVLTLLRDPEWSGRSDRWIADKAAVNQSTVSRIQKELAATDAKHQSTEKVGRDGRTIQTANIGRNRGQETTDALHQSSESSPIPPASDVPSAVRRRRASQSVALLDELVTALEEVKGGSGEPLPVDETLKGVAAVVRWCAGGDSKKARSFLRKLGVKVPDGMGETPRIGGSEKQKSSTLIALSRV